MNICQLASQMLAFPSIQAGVVLGLLSLSSPDAFAGQIHESDIVVSSQVGKVRTEAEGQKIESRTQVHTVDIRRDAATGDVHITGKAGGVTTQAGGQNSNAASAIGGVNVGNK